MQALKELPKSIIIVFLLITPFLFAQSEQSRVLENPTYKFQFPPGKDEVRFPFTLNRNHIILEVEINNRKLNLTLDNGTVMAPTILYGSPKIDSLSLNFDGNVLIGGAGDSDMPGASVARNISIRISDAEILNETVIVMDYNPALLKAFEGEDGVIGGAVWKNFVVKINFDTNEIILTKHKSSSHSGEGEELALGYLSDGGSTLPGIIELESGREVSGIFHLDLGSASPLSINLGIQPELQKPEKTVERKAFGSQGEFTEYIGRISSFRLGKFVLNDVLASFTNTSSLSAMENVGSIGNGIFQRFNVTIDYLNDKIYLDPNGHFKDLFEYNMSGLGLIKMDDGNYKVARIIPDSPASEVDVQMDDIIVKVNGRLSPNFNRYELETLFKKEGEIINLEIMRNNVLKNISLRLKRLI